MKALLIAEGKGTLKGFSIKTSNPAMLKIGGIPILHHHIELLKKYLITEIFILSDRSKKEIIKYFGNGIAFGIQINYLENNISSEISKNAEELKSLYEDDLLIINNGLLINMELGKLIDFHKKKLSECTLVVHPSCEPLNYNLVELDKENKITRCITKPHKKELYFQNLIYTGVALLSPIAVKLLLSKGLANFDGEYLSEICSKMNVFGYNTSEYLEEILTKENLRDAEQDYQTGKFARKNFEFKQKAIFLDRDGVINEEIGYISKPQEMRLYDFTPASIRKANSSGYLSITISNQSSIARGFITLKELKAIHNKMETDLAKENAILDSIYFCPHHPDRSLPGEQSEFKADCLCRKPKPGMLLDAAYEFNIDLSSSFIIGDSERDIMAGMNAGCTTVGVMTGYGLRNTSVLPDFLFANLSEAIDFIVDEPYKEIYQNISSEKIKTPCIISIGGGSRSGKSTLASYLKWKIEQNGKKALVIHLANWIPNGKNINKLTNILHNYQLQKAELDIQQILVGIEVKMLAYSDYSEDEPQEINYQYKGEEYIILEGTLALTSKVLRNLSHIKIFLNSSSEIQKKRFIQMIGWQGKDVEKFSDIYDKIQASELEDVEPGKKYANIIK